MSKNPKISEILKVSKFPKISKTFKKSKNFKNSKYFNNFKIFKMAPATYIISVLIFHSGTTKGNFPTNIKKSAE